MGERTVEHAVQVELRTDTTHTLTWLDPTLKPKPGMVLLCRNDPRPGIVAHTYTIRVQEMRDIHTDWKVGAAMESLA
jgi:hypothetical protein